MDVKNKNNCTYSLCSVRKSYTPIKNRMISPKNKKTLQQLKSKENKDNKNFANYTPLKSSKSSTRTTKKQKQSDLLNSPVCQLSREILNKLITQE